MVDPFLEAHRIGPGIFSVAGRLHPISIRDQIIRRQLFVQRAFREKLIANGPARTGSVPLLNPHRRVVNLDPTASHTCNGARTCYGETHTFELARTSDCGHDEPLDTNGQPYTGPSQTIGMAAAGEAEILVLRHGPRLVGIPQNIQRLLNPLQTRQLLPYGLIA